MAGKKKSPISKGTGRGSKGKEGETPKRPEGGNVLNLVRPGFDEDDELEAPYLDDELPFSAALITPPEPKLLTKFFCPACGAQLVGPKGLEPCPHLIFAMESGENRVLYSEPRFKDLVRYLGTDPDEMDQDPIDVMYDLIVAKFEFPYSILHVELEGFELADVPGEVVLDLVLDFSIGL